MSKSSTTSNDILKLVLQGTDPAWRASATLYLALHTANPGVANPQNTSEATYTGYARVAVTKSSAWTDGGVTFSNAAEIEFPECTGGSSDCYYISIGTASSGAGQILYSDPLSALMAVSDGLVPTFAVGALTFTES